MKKAAALTGASSGIGEATVKRLIELGYTTYAAERRLNRTANLEKLGAILLPLDLTDASSIVQVADRIRDEQGRTDVLVNNAGYGSYEAVEAVPLDQARRQFEVNVSGLARLVQLITPLMRPQRSGKILNLSSISGKGWERLARIIKAVKARRPKTRYAVGARAKPSVFLSTFMPDRFNDWLIGAITNALLKQRRRRAVVAAA
jgi:NAD(P)-dependent dehydrogenase (short-subunit alcohol dehydrogenase family)